MRLWSKRLKFIRQVSESRDSAVNLKILSIENVLTRQAAMIPTVGPATTTLCTIHMNLLGSGNKRGQSNKPISASHYPAGFQNSVTIISHQPLLSLQLPIDIITPFSSKLLYIIWFTRRYRSKHEKNIWIKFSLADLKKPWFTCCILRTFKNFVFQNLPAKRTRGLAKMRHVQIATSNM